MLSVPDTFFGMYVICKENKLTIETLFQNNFSFLICFSYVSISHEFRVSFSHILSMLKYFGLILLSHFKAVNFRNSLVVFTLDDEDNGVSLVCFKYNVYIVPVLKMLFFICTISIKIKSKYHHTALNLTLDFFLFLL